MSAIFLNIIVGAVLGAIVAWVANLISKPATPARNLTTYGLGLVFGALGAQAADQLLDYGPTLMGSNFMPAIAGSVVLAFVVIFAGKRWFHLTA